MSSRVVGVCEDAPEKADWDCIVGPSTVRILN